MYRGQYERDAFHGKGLFRWASGKTYEGDLFDGDFHGQGVMKFARLLHVEANNEYIGEFSHDEHSGYGVMTYWNGNRFEGTWANDKYVEGVYTFANGKSYRGAAIDGMFVNEELEQLGILIDDEGALYQGEIKDGKKHGQGQLIFDSGNTHEGRFVDDKPEGYGKRWYHSSET